MVIDKTYPEETRKGESRGKLADIDIDQLYVTTLN